MLQLSRSAEENQGVNFIPLAGGTDVTFRAALIRCAIIILLAVVVSLAIVIAQNSRHRSSEGFHLEKQFDGK
jgi:hypothetical protein